MEPEYPTLLTSSRSGSGIKRKNSEDVGGHAGKKSAIKGRPRSFKGNGILGDPNSGIPEHIARSISESTNIKQIIFPPEVLEQAAKTLERSDTGLENKDELEESEDKDRGEEPKSSTNALHDGPQMKGADELYELATKKAEKSMNRPMRRSPPFHNTCIRGPGFASNDSIDWTRLVIREPPSPNIHPSSPDGVIIDPFAEIIHEDADGNDIICVRPAQDQAVYLLTPTVENLIALAKDLYPGTPKGDLNLLLMYKEGLNIRYKDIAESDVNNMRTNYEKILEEMRDAEQVSLVKKLRKMSFIAGPVTDESPSFDWDIAYPDAAAFTRDPTGCFIQLMAGFNNALDQLKFEVRESEKLGFKLLVDDDEEEVLDFHPDMSPHDFFFRVFVKIDKIAVHAYNKPAWNARDLDISPTQISGPPVPNIDQVERTRSQGTPVTHKLSKHLKPSKAKGINRIETPQGTQSVVQGNLEAWIDARLIPIEESCRRTQDSFDKITKVMSRVLEAVTKPGEKDHGSSTSQEQAANVIARRTQELEDLYRLQSERLERERKELQNDHALLQDIRQEIKEDRAAMRKTNNVLQASVTLLARKLDETQPTAPLGPPVVKHQTERKFKYCPCKTLVHNMSDPVSLTA
ncbi:hypothetical protein MMC25_004803 [Agyrium rufum]|nr:hypothetical protein [Agyrium rufum]